MELAGFGLQVSTLDEFSGPRDACLYCRLTARSPCSFRSSMTYALARFAGRQEAKQESGQGKQPVTSSDSPSSASTPPTKSDDSTTGTTVDEQASHVDDATAAKAESLPLFEVTMRKDDVESLLRYMCKTEQEKEAWRTGAALPGQQRRVKVVGR